jgi:hypothetical protein
VTPVQSVILARAPDVKRMDVAVTVRPSIWAKRRTGPTAGTVDVSLVKTMFTRRARPMTVSSDPLVTVFPLKVTVPDLHALVDESVPADDALGADASPSPYLGPMPDARPGTDADVRLEVCG